MKALRFFAIIMCIFVSVSLFGCSEIDIGKIVMPFAEMALGETPNAEMPSANIPSADMTTAEIATKDASATTIAVETTAEPFETIEQTQEAVWSTFFVEEPYIPIETVAQTYSDGSCNHLHDQEAEALYEAYGDLFQGEQYRKNKEYLSNHRLVIARGGLRLRDKPSTQTGTQVGLVPDGEIITTIEYRNGWAYAFYDGTYGWCSMEFLFDPFLYPAAGGAPLTQATVTANRGIELVTDRRCYDDDTITTTIPYATRINVYDIYDGRAYVSYKDIYGYCSTEHLEFASF